MYEINDDTLAIIPSGVDKSRIIEIDKEIIVNNTPQEIIEYSCLFFGSSYEGRHKGTKYLLGISYKSPILIEETRNIIFFPTTSPRLDNCTWIGLKNIKNYSKIDNNCILYFSNNIQLNLDVSYGSIDNQILRAARLDSVIRNKKKIG